MKVNKKDVLIMSGTIIAGILSNPNSQILPSDAYGRQNLISSVIQEVLNAFYQSGFDMEEEA